MLQMYVETSTCASASDAGLHVVYCPKSLLVHLESASVTDLARRDEQVRTGWQLLRTLGTASSNSALGSPDTERLEVTLDGVRSFAALALRMSWSRTPRSFAPTPWRSETAMTPRSSSMARTRAGRDRRRPRAGHAPGGIPGGGLPRSPRRRRRGRARGGAALAGAVDAVYTRNLTAVRRARPLRRRSRRRPAAARGAARGRLGA